MRQPFHYICVFYFILATQCQSMDSGATIATDPSFTLTAQSTEQVIKIDPAPENNLVTATPEPMMYATKIDPAPENNLVTATPEPMMYATTAMMVRRGTPPLGMLKQTAVKTAKPTTAKPTTVTATKNTKGTVKGIPVGTNLATSSPATTKPNTVSTTAAKRMAPPQSKSIKLGIKNN
ncbi:MAG: hypothetical protein FJX00_00965 [Alphaproteobacteria bacterium]|nr:hypothetical protein [Alphaproteobacteria bacterium]